MQAFQQRHEVVEEKAQLDERLLSLRNFFTTDTFAALNIDERGRLEQQSRVMGEYSRILARRIENF